MQGVTSFTPATEHFQGNSSAPCGPAVRRALQTFRRSPSLWRETPADNCVVRRESHFNVGPVRHFRARHRRFGMRGFSLIEMLTTMSVLVILLAIAAPGLASLTSANAVSAAESDLATVIVLARSEALKRGAVVAIAGTSPVRGA